MGFCLKFLIDDGKSATSVISCLHAAFINFKARGRPYPEGIRHRGPQVAAILLTAAAGATNRDGRTIVWPVKFRNRPFVNSEPAAKWRTNAGDVKTRQAAVASAPSDLHLTREPLQLFLAQSWEGNFTVRRPVPRINSRPRRLSASLLRGVWTTARRQLAGSGITGAATRAARRKPPIDR